MSDVAPLQDSLSFGLPVSARKTGRDVRDYARLEILLRSMRQSEAFNQMDGFWIITPPDEVSAVSVVVNRLLNDPRVVVISELELCPILEKGTVPRSFYLSRFWDAPLSRAVPGWHKQQFLKLAISTLVRTKYYLTLDADLICVRPMRMTDLVRDGKAVCGVETVNDYREIYKPGFVAREIKTKGQRVAWAERILGQRRSGTCDGQYYSETPVLMSTSGVRDLLAFLESKYQMPWATALVRSLPWTEYPLYFQFLEMRDALDRFYSIGGRNAMLRLDQSLWHASSNYLRQRSLGSWDPNAVFERDQDGYFVAVQSYLRYDMDQLILKLQGHISGLTG